MIKFEWDTKKSVANQKKNGICFEESKSVFYDEFAVQFYDEGHSGLNVIIIKVTHFESRI